MNLLKETNANYLFFYYEKWYSESKILDLQNINERTTEQCNFTLADNKDLPVQNRQWGVGPMVGFQVRGHSLIT